MDVYYYLVNNPGFHGVREIQRSLNYSSPSLVSYHLGRLLDAKIISKLDDGQYGIIRDDVKLGPLKDHVKLINYWIPRQIILAFTLLVLSSISVFFTMINADAILWGLVFTPVTIIFAVVIVVSNLLVDLTYGLIDPRIRLQ